MNIDIKLFVHGVPKGQRIWGDPTYDNNYIETFYGRKSQATSQMLVEVKQFGSSTNCYYTYMRLGNICDSDGRAGAYMALTLRLNYYYADIANMYNVLDAAYNKFVVGTLLSENNGASKFLVTDFSQATSHLKSLENELKNYLMQFSSNSDFVAVNGFKVNGQNEAASVNLQECDSKSAAAHIKANSKLSVSPLYPSAREQKLLQTKNAEISEINTRAQQQIAAAQQQAQSDIRSAQKQAEQSVSNAKREKDEAILSIQNQYKDADRTIARLRKDLDSARGEVERLSQEVVQLKNRLNSESSFKTRYEQANAQYQQVKKKLDEIYQFFGVNGDNFVNKKKGKDIPPTPKPKNPVNIAKKILSICKDSFIIIAIIAIGAKFFLQEDKSTDTKQELFAETEQVEQTPTFNEGESLRQLFAKANIIVNDSKPISKKANVFYSLALSDVDYEGEGEWISSSFEIKGDSAKPKEEGLCKIYYVVNNDTLVSKEVNVSK